MGKMCMAQYCIERKTRCFAPISGEDSALLEIFLGHKNMRKSFDIYVSSWLHQSTASRSRWCAEQCSIRPFYRTTALAILLKERVERARLRSRLPGREQVSSLLLLYCESRQN